MAMANKLPILSDNLRGKQLTHIGHLTRQNLDEVIALGEWFRDHAEERPFSDLLRGRVDPRRHGMFEPPFTR